MLQSNLDEKFFVVHDLRLRFDELFHHFVVPNQVLKVAFMVQFAPHLTMILCRLQISQLWI